MASIKVELEKIAGLANGQDVLDAIASASEKVNQNEFDITEELEIIRSRANRYGIDIRMAIHDALEKLQRKAEPKGPLYFSNSKTQAKSNGLILPTILGLYEAPPCPFTCDAEYFVDSAVSYSVPGRTWQKVNPMQAVGMMVCVSEGSTWTIGLLISPVAPSAVSYTNDFDGHVTTYEGTVSYEGFTWYYSNTSYAMDKTSEVSGLTKYQPSYDEAIPHPYQREDIIDILKAVHAHKAEV